MVATVAGRVGYFTLNSANISAYLDDVSMQRIKDLIDVSTFRQGSDNPPTSARDSKSFAEGLRDATLTLSGNYDATLANLSDVLNTAYVASGGVPFEFGPNGSAQNNEKFSGTVHVKDYSLKQGVGTIVKFSASLQVSGALTRGAF